jgi:hypothetical protein
MAVVSGHFSFPLNILSQARNIKASLKKRSVVFLLRRLSARRKPPKNGEIFGHRLDFGPFSIYIIS